jgi:hypothetical protein
LTTKEQVAQWFRLQFTDDAAFIEHFRMLQRERYHPVLAIHFSSNPRRSTDRLVILVYVEEEITGIDTYCVGGIDRGPARMADLLRQILGAAPSHGKRLRHRRPPKQHRRSVLLD